MQIPHLKEFLKTNIKIINGALNRIYSLNIPIVFANNEEESFENVISDLETKRVTLDKEKQETTCA